MLEELEHDVSELETGFEQVRDKDAKGSLRQKQQRAEQLLEEIHGQLRFLKQQVESGKS